MGVLRPDNGDAVPSDDAVPPDDHGPDGLPDLPPEWGTIVIPDDAAELDVEAAEIRREMRRESRRVRIRRLLGLPQTRPGDDAPNLGVPLVIMVVAVMTTLISLFVVTWDRSPPAPVPLNTGTDLSLGAASSAATAAADTPLTEVDFTDVAGHPVRLGTWLPAVLVLVDGCTCGDFVLRTAELVPAGVSVIAAARAVPPLAGVPASVHLIGDRDGVLRTRYAPTLGQTPGRPAVLLLNRSGLVVATLPAVGDVNEIRPALSTLGVASAPAR